MFQCPGDFHDGIFLLTEQSCLKESNTVQTQRHVDMVKKYCIDPNCASRLEFFGL